eukprot:gene10925-11080_t
MIGSQLSASSARLLWLLLLLICYTPGIQALNSCLHRPWEDTGEAAGAQTVTVSLKAFEDLQQHIDRAHGPTIFIISPQQKALLANQVVSINKANITVVSSSAYLSSSSSSNVQQLAVECGAAKSLLHIRAPGVSVLGLHVSGCTGGAVQVQSAKRTVIRSCTFTSNVNSGGSAGGGAVTASKSQLWVDSCVFKHNAAEAGPGGAVSATGSQLLVTGSSFSGNKAMFAGGALAVVGRADPAAAASAAAASCWRDLDVAVDSCRLESNHAVAFGGCLSTNGSHVSLQDSTAEHNSAKLGGVVYAGQAAQVAIRSSSSMSNNSAAASGGVVYAAGPGVRVLLQTSKFSGNSAKVLGGVLSARDSAAVKLDGSSFSNNSADLAAGVLYAKGADLAASGCSFEHNVASRDGGVLYCAGMCKWTVQGCTFKRNRCNANGGVLFGWNVDVSMSSSSLEGNAAGVLGGAVSLANSTVALHACKLGSNSATGKDAAGGGLYSQGSRVNLTDCMLTANVASWGGGIYITNSTLGVLGGSIMNSSVSGSGAGLHVLRSTANLTNVTLASNEAQKLGGSLYCNSSACYMTGCDVTDDSAALGAGCVWIGGYSSLSLRGSHFLGCLAVTGGGGGVLADAAISVAVVGCSFTACRALKGSGGGLLLHGVSAVTVKGSLAVLRGLGAGIYAASSRVMASRMRLERNSADSVGGGAYLAGCGVRISRSSISKNTAGEEAGGLKLVNPAQGSTLSGCVVAANWAGVRAGGLALVGVDSSSEVAVVGVDVVNNTAAGESAGGVLVSGPLGVLMVGGELSGNAAGASSAADYQSGSSAAAASGDLFTGRDSSGDDGSLEATGGGLLAEGCSWLALKAVDVWGNAAPSGCGGGLAAASCAKVLLDSSVVEGNVAGSGGGMCVTGIPGFLTLHNSSISSNRALLGGVWGGLESILSPTPEPHLHCGVPGTGGGLCVESQGQFLINGSSISRNQARNGGAMALGLCDDSSRCSLGLIRASFTNNSAVQGGGGAAYFTTQVAPDQVRIPTSRLSDVTEALQVLTAPEERTYTFDAGLVTLGSLIDAGVVDKAVLDNVGASGMEVAATGAAKVPGDPAGASRAQADSHSVLINWSWNPYLMTCDPTLAVQFPAACPRPSKSYGPVVTSRPAGLRIASPSSEGDTGPTVVYVAAGGQVQVQLQVVDVFGGVVTSGAADYFRVKATLNPTGAGTVRASSMATPAAAAAVAGVAAAAAGGGSGAVRAEQLEGDVEVDGNGVVLSGLQQLSASNGSLILSGMKLSGRPGLNTTLYIVASDPSLLPASVPISLTSCNAGYMQLPGTCQPCPPGTYSFSPVEPVCALCPAGAVCNGTVLVPLSGFWHSNPRSAQVHACLNPAACARDTARQQHLAEWQAAKFGEAALVGSLEDVQAEAQEKYMEQLCAPGYRGQLCSACVQTADAVAANRVSHGRVNGVCVECDSKTVVAMYILARLYDLCLWAALTWLAWRAAKAWAKAMLSIITFSGASYAWPQPLKTFMTGFTFVPLGTSKWVSADCLLPQQLSYRRSIVSLLVTAALPLFYLGSAAGVWLISLMMGKTHRTPILALVVGTGLFYPLITMSALSAFSCHYIDGAVLAPGEVASAQGSYWTVDPGLKCYEGQHLQLML